MSHVWTVKDGEGHALPCFAGASRLEVERKVVPTHYDVFRLLVSSSDREMFARELAKVLTQNGWRVVRHKNTRGMRGRTNAQLEFKLN